MSDEGHTEGHRIMIDWLWNFVPLGIVKFVGRRFGTLSLEITIGNIGPFPVRAIGGILVRDSSPKNGDSNA